jgi:IS30 family transposase
MYLIVIQQRRRKGDKKYSCVESCERLQAHIQNFKARGVSYLSLKNFVHKNTDGPQNIYSTVWTKKSLAPLLRLFFSTRYKLLYLNERHLLGLQKVLPASLKNSLAKRLGWHL